MYQIHEIIYLVEIEMSTTSFNCASQINCEQILQFQNSNRQKNLHSISFMWWIYIFEKKDYNKRRSIYSKHSLSSLWNIWRMFTYWISAVMWSFDILHLVTILRQIHNRTYIFWVCCGHHQNTMIFWKTLGCIYLLSDWLAAAHEQQPDFAIPKF